MAAFEVIALDTATPQLRAPGASDTYTFPRAVEMPLGTANGVLYLNGSKVVTSGSALTFDGTTFAVNSAASIGSSTAKTKFYSDSTYNGIFNGASLIAAESVYMGAGGLFFFTSGSEQMRLTSTGLGIGTSSPGAKLDVRSATAGVSVQVKSTWSDAAQIIDRQDLSSNAFVLFRTAGVDGYSLGQFSGGASALEFRRGGLTRMLLDTSGNLGLGVTPSAWVSYKVLQVAGTGGGIASSSSSDLELVTNAYYSGGWLSQGAGVASSRYRLQSGAHAWFTAPSGTAGNPISFTQAMTLDASGNLGIGTTSATTRVTSDYGPSAAINVSTPNSTTSLTLGASDPGTVALGFGTLLQFRGIIGRGAVAAIGGVYGGTNKDGDLSLVFYRNSGNGTIAEAARIDPSGNVVVNTGAIATSATNGFFYVAGCGGTPTGTPTAYTGRVPIVVDTTNHKLYFYSGGAWRDAGP